VGARRLLRLSYRCRRFEAIDVGHLDVREHPPPGEPHFIEMVAVSR
jgi:hypothetical protein